MAFEILGCAGNLFKREKHKQNSVSEFVEEPRNDQRRFPTFEDVGVVEEKGFRGTNPTKAAEMESV
jgi:hypothetical protein